MRRDFKYFRRAQLGVVATVVTGCSGDPSWLLNGLGLPGWITVPLYTVGGLLLVATIGVLVAYNAYSKERRRKK